MTIYHYPLAALCPSVQNLADKRKCKFMKKYAMSTNSICQLLAKMCV